MIVCICRNVSDKAIAATVASGVCTFEGLQQCTGVSTGCGKCIDHAKQVFEGSCRPTQMGHQAVHTTDTVRTQSSRRI